MDAVRIVPLDETHFLSMRACLDAVAREERYLAFTEAPPEEAARSCLEVMLSSNTAAIRLYEREGFVSEGTKRRARILHGNADDITQMALFLP